MLKSNMDTAPTRRAPVRVDQDGPWSVSVAESPHDTRSYSLYIKTPTHNLTLTRSTLEIVELDHKLRESTLPNTKLPKFPLDPATLPAPTPKRKSAFLNTLSRLASPTSNKSAKHNTNGTTSRRSTNTSTNGATPAASPSTESGDPFQSFSASSAMLNASLPTPSANSTALAAYFTTLSNTTGVRQARVWKRFVRVRTDDLESVRVERPLKHVRSDLAAHLGITKDKKERKKDLPPVVTQEEVDQEPLVKDTGVEDVPAQSDAKADEMEVVTEPTTSSTAEAPTTAKETDKVVDITTPRASEDEPRTPLPSDQPAPAAEPEPAPSPAPDSQSQTSTSTSARVPRSHSADPDRRMSRAYLSSSVSGSQTETSQTETGDESSSVSTSRRPGSRKKKGTVSAPGTSSDSTSQPISKEAKTRKSQRKVVVDDFEMLRVLGKGCAGKVLLVRHKATTDLYAMKAITKRHVLAHQELQHTLTEQAVLRRMSAAENTGEGVKDPFVVKLWWSFHDKENLFLVMDFHPGGDLATQLARWGRLGRDRARFYAAEIVEGVEGLHAMGVIYRDLKPENILIGGDGHIVLTDFGLSKEFPAKRAGVNGMNAKSADVTVTPTAPSTPSGTRSPTEFVSAPWSSPSKDLPSTQVDQTTTFCGTAEYLAPEVIQGLPYSYEVDWWSFGTMLFEMLTGITPFWANNHADMYMRVLQDELQFPDDRAIDQDTKSLLRGLLQRNPALRICEPRIKRHPYFSMIDWSHVYYKRYIPPYIPPIDPSNASDTQNFDDTFLDMEPVLDDVQDDEEGPEQTDTDDNNENTDTDRTDDDGDEANTTPSQSRSSSAVRPKKAAGEEPDDSVDVFDGYSFKGRHSVLIGSDEDGESEEETDEETDEEEIEAGEIDLEPQQQAKPEVEVQQHRESEQPKQPVPDDVVEEEDVEPKTPEARPPVALPPDDTKIVEEITTPPKDEAIPKAAEAVVETKPRKSKELTGAAEEKEKAEKTEKVEKEPKETKEKDSKTAKPTPPPKVAPPPPAKTNRSTRPRKERSGVPALDKYLSDAPEEDGITEREDFDDEDDDWDFVEAVDGEERNGAKGTSLFARGVVDKYKLAVFNRKTSTPNKSRNGLGSRSASGVSYASGVSTPPHDSNEAGGGLSPSPSQRRGRNPGLTFRKHPRQFLRPKSPPSSYSPKSSGTTKSSIPSSLATSNSNTLSSMTSMSTQFSASSTNGSGTLAGTQNHSLKSKESALSMGAASHSSDQSNPDGVMTDVPSPSEEPETIKGQSKNNKLKKYKENAEKVLSLFSASPKQPQLQTQQPHAQQ